MRRGRWGHQGRGYGRRAMIGRLSRFVEPAILLALQTGDAAHGYDLVAVANELQLTEVPIDAAAIYRALRQLEEDGLVTSTWDTSRPGPARRNYKLTPAGRHRLRDWIEVIERRAEALRNFVNQARSAFGQAPSQPEPDKE